MKLCYIAPTNPLHMNEYVFFDKVFMRCPVFSYNLYKDLLKDPLNDELFMSAMYVANKQFYHELVKKLDISALDEKARLTLTKYINRSCYRPTPLGLFSSFSIINWEDGVNKIRFPENSLTPFLQLDWHRVRQLAHKLQSEKLNPEIKIYSNPSIYKAGKDYRYYKTNYDQTSGKSSYFIQLLSSNTLIKSLTHYCSTPKTTGEVKAVLQNKFNLTTAETDTFFERLLEEQLLFTDLEINITGVDYSRRMIKRNKIPLDAQQLWQHINSIDKPKCAETLIKADESVAAVLPPEPHSNRSENYYVNLARKRVTGALSSDYQRKILSAVELLKKINAKKRNPSLVRFVSGLKEKFGTQTIPLLIALDPEIGVGYESLTTGAGINILTNDVDLRKKNEDDTNSIAWGPVNKMLLNLWPASRRDTLIINRERVAELEWDDEPMPDDLTVVFRAADEMIIIDHITAGSATALIGRFTPFDTDVHNFAAAVARYEVERNPGVLFAELAYTADDHVDNINRRLHVWPFEIPILTPSTLDTENQIQLSDLWITTNACNQVILLSGKHRKQVIPRLSSAYNFVTSDLAVFRFLCDLQYQDRKTDFSFNFQGLFPGLEHYPRVQAGQTIISLASWHLTAHDFAPIFKLYPHSWYGAFKQLADKIKLCNKFMLVWHDQELVFDLENEESILFFLKNIKSRADNITLKEYIVTDVNSPLVTDEQNLPYVGQFIAALKKTDGRKMAKHLKKSLPDKWRYREAIGNEWIYFKIYCHENQTNHLLVNYLLPVLRSKFCSKWFFIRYYDPGHHIRLRIRTDDPAIFDAIRKALSTPVNEGFVTDLNTAIYKKELPRYGKLFMPIVEQFFCFSSELTLCYLDRYLRGKTGLEIHQYALLTADAMITCFKADANTYLEFCDSVFNNFLNEYENKRQIKIDADQKYRLMKGDIEELLRRPDTQWSFCPDYITDNFLGLLLVLQQKVKAAKAEALLADLVHMHLNRVFETEQRSQEMIIYYLLYKHKKSVSARKKSLQNQSINKFL